MSWLAGSPMDPTAEAPEPVDPLPGFPFAIPSACAVVAGPTGAGRSSLVQACAYDAARQGLRVLYLGSEVTEPEFNARAADLANRRRDPITQELRDQLARVKYADLATVAAQAWADPQGWKQQAVALYDVIIVDPLAPLATTLGLDFDKSNADFSQFYDRLVQPLVTAGLTVVLLENIGHAIEAKTRAKGASAKQDRADITLSCKLKARPVGLIITAGKVRSVRAPFARGDSWVFDRETQRIERDTGANTATADPSTPWRPHLLMERVSREIETTPGISRTAIRNRAQGKTQRIGQALDLLVADGYAEHRDSGYHSTRPYRQPATDVPAGSRQETAPAEEPVPARSPHSSAVPGLFPAADEETRSPVPPPLRERGRDRERPTSPSPPPRKKPESPTRRPKPHEPPNSFSPRFGTYGPQPNPWSARRDGWGAGRGSHEWPRCWADLRCGGRRRYQRGYHGT